MNTDKLKLWTDALRSGEYRQGRGNLASRDGDTVKYCCLGVACEVAIKDGLYLEVTWGRESETLGFVDLDMKFYDREDLVLPRKVQEWLGVAGMTAVEVDSPDESGIRDSVIDLNDSEEWTFDDIAEALEHTYLKEEK